MGLAGVYFARKGRARKTRCGPWTAPWSWDSETRGTLRAAPERRALRAMGERK